MRRPHEAGRQHERASLDGDLFARRGGAVAGGARDAPRFGIGLQLAHQRFGHERDALARDQCVPRKIGRVLGAGGADGIAGVTPLTLTTPVLRHRVLRARRAPRGNAGLSGPLLQLREVVVDRQRRQRIRLTPRIERDRSLLAGYAHPLLGLLIKRIEVVVAKRPVTAHAVHRTQPEVLRRIARRYATPVHRQPTHVHAGRKSPCGAGGVLVVEVILLPWALAVGFPSFARPYALGKRRGRLACFDHQNRLGRLFGQRRRHQCGRDAAAYDDDVGTVRDHALGSMVTGNGLRVASPSVRHTPGETRAPSARSHASGPDDQCASNAIAT